MLFELRFCPLTLSFFPGVFNDQSNIGLGKIRQEALKSANAQPSDLTSLSSSEERAATLNGIPERDQPAGTNPSVASAQSSASSSTTFNLNLSSLPSSFTTLLLSLVDTPAYHNLTTSFLRDDFNPSTPNMPNVKYYSIASRVGGVSIWHPLWLPKIVLDGAEEKERKKWREEGRHGWDNEALWGNDGLVTIQSARWGEFLGVMEGCDHWEMRGARGLDINLNLPRLDVDLGLQNLGLGNMEWSLKDWSKFVRAWRSEEKREQERREQDFATAVAESISHSSPPTSSPASEREAAKAKEQAEHAHAEAMLKASTDKLSAVFDWLVEQVPASSQVTSRSVINAVKEDEAVARKKGTTPVNELATKEDLERMYVALARKLYDDGL
jgi:triacylglycerol lipase